MIAIEIQDEHGGRIEEFSDPGAIYLLAGSEAVRCTACLRFIDPYGDTTFNQYQLSVLIDECVERLAHLEGAERVRAERLVSFLRQGVGRVHTYVKFIGD